MTKEKRRHKRLDARLFAELALMPDGAARGRAIVTDVTVAGVAIEAEADFAVGDLLECSIEIPIVIRAIVVRSQVKGQVKNYGLKFVSQSIFDRFVLKRILKGKRHTRKVNL